MSVINTAWCRVFQFGMSLASRFVYWPRPESVAGNGKSLEIGEIIRKNGKTKVMIVTGRHVGKSLAPAIKDSLDKAGIPYCHYDQVEANPSTTTVFAIRDLYKKENCDCFLAIGGGSAMDAAKGAGALVARPGKLPGQLAGLLKVGKKTPLFIAVPTTAGTGSETTMAAVITDAETHHKYAIMDPKLIPDYAVFDPELTRDLPKATTATTGMDALTHAVEAYLCWTNTTKESNRCALKATVEIFKYLERAYNDGNDMEAREKMLLASCDAGYAFSRAGVGNVHAIAHTLGGLYGIPHGLANAVILPIVLEDYGEKAYKKLARLAEITGIKTDGSYEDKAKAFIAEVYAMNERMGIPKGIDVIRDEDIPQMVKWALAEANPVYPVPLVYDEEHCAEMIRLIRAKAAE